jgi:hypothetical protein
MSQEYNCKLIVCASIAYMEDRVRLNKFKEVFSANKTDFIFWGWRRGNSQRESEYKVKHLWVGGGFSSKKLFLHYPVWIIMIFINSFRISKNDIIYAVSLDVALPIYLGSFFKKYKYIFDNPDNFSLTYNLNGFPKYIIDKIEYLVAKRATYHIVPDKTRFTKNLKNLVVLPNFPLDSEISRAKQIYLQEKELEGVSLVDIKKDSRFKIYINGRMVKHRGSEWIADTFAKLDTNKFLIIVAGNIYCNILENQLKKLNNAIMFPRLENYQALSLYFYIDIVLAFYDPILPINRKAAANKWWDCVACKVPFISNIEIETLEIFKKEEACFTISYNSKELNLLLENLIQNPEELLKVKKNLEKLSVFKWGDKMNDIINKIKEN